MLKKLFVLQLALVMLLCQFPGNCVLAEEEPAPMVALGQYVQLGKYEEKPILWRCINTEDENGILLLSDRILCEKAFNLSHKMGSYEAGDDVLWETSAIRIWLNSTAEAGKVEWIDPYIPSEENAVDIFEVKYPYDKEKGFLSEDNFSKSELAAMKTVSQWQALEGTNKKLATNGVLGGFRTCVIQYPNSEMERVLKSYGIKDLKDVFYCSMYRVPDTMFLLNETQLYTFWENFGDISPTTEEIDGYGWWWLRTPVHLYMISMAGMNKAYLQSSYYNEHGIRPAFYLNEATAQIKSGSGTMEDPYIIDGTVPEETVVFSNGEQVDFDVEPVTENDRKLVGMRAIFESLGAEIAWNGEENKVTAVKDDTTIELQINQSVMHKNGEEITLDAPARIVNDRTMVPLRAVSEALDAKVDWIENLNRIVIDPKQPWETGEGYHPSPEEVKYNGKKKFNVDIPRYYSDPEYAEQVNSHWDEQSE